MNFEYYLYQFLLKNHKAELSGFGVFLLTKESAKIDTENAIIIPPKENISLQLLYLDSNDDFARFVSQETKVDLETVKVNLEKVLSNWKYKLENEPFLTLDNLGQYKLDADKTIVKITDNQAEVYGLEEISLKKIKKSKSSINNDYAMAKPVILVFIALMIVGGITLCYFGNMDLVFGKKSEIPPKQDIQIILPKKVEPKIDTIKTDTLKQISNAEIQNAKK